MQAPRTGHDMPPHLVHAMIIRKGAGTHRALVCSNEQVDGELRRVVDCPCSAILVDRRLAAKGSRLRLPAAARRLLQGPAGALA